MLKMTGEASPSTPIWKQYQDDAAALFASLGFETEVEARIAGARSVHAVDVAARFRAAGIEQLWIVECKAWNRRVPKERVLSFRTVIEDTGADRGFLLSESGFQSGALTAARFASITLTDLENLHENAEADIQRLRLDRIHKRVADAKWRLSNLPPTEETRRAGHGYLQKDVLALLNEQVESARLGKFPLRSRSLERTGAGVSDAPDMASFLVAAESALDEIEAWREALGDNPWEAVEKLISTESFREQLGLGIASALELQGAIRGLGSERLLELDTPVIANMYQVAGVALAGLEVPCRLMTEVSTPIGDGRSRSSAVPRVERTATIHLEARVRLANGEVEGVELHRISRDLSTP